MRWEQGTLYDAGRTSLWAILANDGLRLTTRGDWIAWRDAYNAGRAATA